jgi:hypothetical protein
VNESRDPSLSDYPMVGDTRTAAPVSLSGSIDWMCVPNFGGQPIDHESICSNQPSYAPGGPPFGQHNVERTRAV